MIPIVCTNFRDQTLYHSIHRSDHSTTLRPRQNYTVVENLVELLSCSDGLIIETTLEFLLKLLSRENLTTRLNLANDGFFHEILSALDPSSLPLDKFCHVHLPLIHIIKLFHIEHSGNQDEASPPDPEYLTHMHETFLIHVLGPLEAYLRFLNTHRFTISTMTQLNGHYVDLLLILLEACFSHSPTMSFIFSSSIPMTAASLVSASETDQHLWKLVFHYRRKLDTRSNMDGHANKNMNEVICRLGDEGLENELDQHLFTDKAGYQARTTVEEIIQLSNQLGMNIEGV